MTFELKAYANYTHMGSNNINISKLGSYANFSSIGSGNIRIGFIESGVKIDRIGSGYLFVAEEIGEQASIHLVGSGDAYFAKNISNNVKVITEGSGDLTIVGATGEKFILRITGPQKVHLNEVGKEATISSVGSNNLIITGKVGERTRFNFQGEKLYFQSILDETVEFDGELCNEVWFDIPPSQTILSKIKRAQECALTSHVGFSSMGNYQIKKGAGWVRVKENGKDTLYTGNEFRIVNGVKYMDGKIIEPSPSANPSSFLAKINHFSDKYPALFLLGTLGLGLLWYVGKWVSNFSSFFYSHGTTPTLDCRRSEDPRAYYLADISALNSKNDATIPNSNVIIPPRQSYTAPYPEQASQQTPSKQPPEKPAHPQCEIPLELSFLSYQGPGRSYCL